MTRHPNHLSLLFFISFAVMVMSRAVNVDPDREDPTSSSSKSLDVYSLVIVIGIPVSCLLCSLLVVGVYMMHRYGKLIPVVVGNTNFFYISANQVWQAAYLAWLAFSRAIHSVFRLKAERP